jgi:hypothetical protein
MVGGVPRSLKAKGPSKKEMGKAYENTIKAILESVDEKHKGLVEQINKILGEFQNQIQQTLGGQEQNFVGAIQRALDIAYTGDVHLTVIRKFMFEKLGISEEEYDAAIEAEVKLRDETRKRQIEEHNARMEAAKKAMEEQKVKDDEAAVSIQAEMARLCADSEKTHVLVRNGALTLQYDVHPPVTGGVGFILEKLKGINSGDLRPLLEQLAEPPEHSPELGTVTEENEPVMFGGDYQAEEKPATVKEVIEHMDEPVDPLLKEAAKIGSDAILEELHRDPQNYGDEPTTTPPTDPDIE